MSLHTLANPSHSNVAFNENGHVPPQECHLLFERHLIEDDENEISDQKQTFNLFLIVSQQIKDLLTTSVVILN